MVCRQVGIHQTNNLSSVPPGSLQNLVCGAMKIKTVDIRCLDCRTFRHSEGRSCCCGYLALLHSHAPSKVSSALRFRLIRQRPPTYKSATCDNSSVLVGTQFHFHRQSSRFISKTFEGSEKLDTLEAFDVPTWKDTSCGLGERLNPHDAGKYWYTINLVIEKEWLNLGIECDIHGEPTIDSHRADAFNHGTVTVIVLA